MPGKDLLVDAVRKTQDVHKTFLSAIKNVSNAVIFDSVYSKFTRSRVIKQQQNKLQQTWSDYCWRGEFRTGKLLVVPSL